MKYLILLSLFACPLGNSLSAQSATDTLQVEALQKMTHLADLYLLPDKNYQLDHFVAFISLPGIDPIAVYNQGNTFLPNTIENINRLTQGSKLSILVYASNTDHPEIGPVKLPRKEYVIK